MKANILIEIQFVDYVEPCRKFGGLYEIHLKSNRTFNEPLFPKFKEMKAVCVVAVP